MSAISELIGRCEEQHAVMVAYEGLREQLGAEATAHFDGQENVAVRMDSDGVRVFENGVSTDCIAPNQIVEAGGITLLLPAVENPNASAQSPNVVAFNNAVAGMTLTTAEPTIAPEAKPPGVNA